MRYLLLLIILCSPNLIWAQMHCGREAVVKDDSWRAKQAVIEQEVQLYIQQANFAEQRNGPITIPVVFHQLAEYDSDFLSDFYFESQINILNADFGNYSANNSGTPFDLREIPVDMGLRFCMAQVDPNGLEHSGINRLITNDPCIGDIGGAQTPEGTPKLYYKEFGGADAWDSRFYLNIWVAPTCGSYLGFATFPNEAIPNEDGVIINTEYFGLRDANTSSYPYHLGRVCTHEVGHYFNLLHLWGEGGCDSDDLVEDTPTQESFHLGCSVHPNSSCDSPDYFFNFMDYSDDECLSMFTNGQRQRALATLYTQREELLENASCTSWGPTPLANEWQIFPNPSSDLLYVIPPPSWPRPIPYSIYDSVGRLIKEGSLQKNPFAINTQSLGAGYFLLRLENGKEQISQPFLSFP